ncbi:transcriptional regulator, XRE family [Formosa sp. Hel1_33_131]|uniref:helix-turn-helix domain-containing protein n=1 Tax=Formosa sp. Hel1_33_131 TaxID=1336794 RepID=UPI00084E166A|nr:helix-turn-helix transcriptional regulator [Formosa sp. Hel1_33_131]AOR27586.1 transcriptional regulator, XRE family [Formosa sp. Hel1_33_131]
MNNIRDFEDLLIAEHGKKGTEKRDKYDADSLAFRLGIMLKEARKEANLTQEELAERTGTKKSYISRIERGLSDIQVSTYYKLIELGLGKHLNIEIA